MSVGLILEGGGMRSLYTAGVLDAFIDKKIEFKYCIGVSAGACCGVSYVAKQKKRHRDANIKYISDKRYFGIRNFFKTGYAMGNEFIFNQLAYDLVPVDIDGYNKYINSGGIFIAGVTNCVTGDPEYYLIDDLEKKGDYINASSSLPLLSPMIKKNGKFLLDGGLSDSIPLDKSIADGNEKNVVILTRDINYRKTKSKLIKVLKLKYKKFPKLIGDIETRYQRYNETAEHIAQMEKTGDVLVIRPEKPIIIGRIEKDPQKLDDLYKIGYADGILISQKVKDFIRK